MKTQQKFLVFFGVMVFAFLFQGCVKDTCTHTYSYTWFEPLYKTTEQVRQSIKTDPAVEVKAIGKLFIKGNYIFLNEINKGVHIIDNSNPSAPVNKGFINIPGNIDIAVKGNVLYADLFTDLVAIDISDPLNTVTKKIINNVFPARYYNGFAPDSTKVVYDWVRHDTTIAADCGNSNAIFSSDLIRRGVAVPTAQLSNNAAFTGGSPVGIAGSMARFALVNDYLYTVGDLELKSIDISTPQNPVVVNSENLTWGVEAIYPFKDKLFIGSTSGMFIYDIANAANPLQAGTFSHARVCDPVIADDDYAFVTLRNGTECQGFINELDIVDIKNLSAPVLLKKYDMTNPHGLSKDGDLLFICDGRDGLRVFNAADVYDIKLIKQLTGLETYDVIAYGNLAIVVAKDGLYQFDYSDTTNILQVSKIAISN
jgi:hypothetical protein